MRPYQDHHEPKPRERRRSARGLGGDGEQDTFLDRMSGLLDAIARECATIGRTEDSSAVLAKATTAFEGVQRLCREAGIVNTDAEEEERSPVAKNHATRVVPVRAHELQLSQPHSHAHMLSQRPQETRLKHPTASREMELKIDEAAHTHDSSEDGSLPPPTPLRYRLPLSTGEDIIEVEITDILTSTQEEIQRWKHDFRLQLMEQEARQHDQNRAHMEQIQALKDALTESQRHISKLARTIQDTNEKLEATQSLHTKSQKAMELTLKEHTSYWKAICHDLVTEKRAIATKLAEERGKYHALREHIGLHESADKCDAVEPPSSSSYPTKAKRSSSSYATKPATSKSHLPVYAANAKADDYLASAEDASPPRASFRRYYLSKS